MIRSLYVLALVGVLTQFGGGEPALGADAIAGLLPPGSQVLAEEQIPGATHDFAFVYRFGRDFVGLAQTNKDTRILTQRVLPGSFRSLHMSTVPGVVETVTTKSGGGQWICSFATSGHDLRPALKSATDGCLFGEEGVRVHASGFSVRARDSTHVGIVRYRLISHYEWKKSHFSLDHMTRSPDYPKGNLPKPRGLVHTRTGDVVLLKLDVAATQQQQATGLMYRRSLDPDAGMIFQWQQPVRESFWMENTYVPLSIAFLSPQGTVQEVQNMQPLTTDLHTPALPYQYAIEMNQDYFVNHGIRVGDHIALTL